MTVPHGIIWVKPPSDDPYYDILTKDFTSEGGFTNSEASLNDSMYLTEDWYNRTGGYNDYQFKLITPLELIL